MQIEKRLGVKLASSMVYIIYIYIPCMIILVCVSIK